MKLKTCPYSKVKAGTRVLMRVDFNIPMEKGRVTRLNDRRLTAPIDDMNALVRQGAKVILMTHLGRPGGKVVQSLSTKPLSTALSKKIKPTVKHVPSIAGAKAELAVSRMKDGDVLMLENLRFHSGEEKNSASFAKALSKLGDVYVNNAFGVCHRKHASVSALPKKMGGCAGTVLQNEIRELSVSLAKPLVIILGGIKLEAKIPLLKQLAPKADAILLGSGVGALVYAVDADSPISSFGKTFTKGERAAAKSILKAYRSKLVFPIDMKVTKSKTGAHVRSVPLKILEHGQMTFDLGEHTIELYRRILVGAKSVVWNGPVGVVEKQMGQDATLALAKILSDLEGARTVLGGGDTIGFLDTKKLAQHIDFISTGGGAMLAFLAGEELPGLEVLKK